ncbi:hypothetical protein TNCV_2923201, partial [Trichonephila clavipes]
MSSRWCGVVVRRGVPAQVSSRHLTHGSKLSGPSSKALVANVVPTHLVPLTNYISPSPPPKPHDVQPFQESTAAIIPPSSPCLNRKPI